MADIEGVMRVASFLFVAILITSCQGPIPQAHLDWCMSDEGLSNWEFAASLDHGWPDDLPRNPTTVKLVSADDTTGLIPLTTDRSIPKNDYSHVFEYESLKWTKTLLEWAADHPSEFEKICQLAVENEPEQGDRLSSDPDPIQVDSEKLSSYETFISDMGSVSEGSVFEALHDLQLVYIGKQLCLSLEFIGLGVGSASDTRAESERIAEDRVDIIMTEVFAVHPPNEGETYAEYEGRILGQEWSDQLREFSAALMHDSSRFLCPEQADYVDSLVLEN